MPKYVSLGSWLAQMFTEVPTFNEMSSMNKGVLTMKPTTKVQRSWAIAIKNHLKRDGVDSVVID